jgi:transposase-like protein
MSDLLKNSDIVTTLQTLVKTLKTPEDLVNLNNQLTKITIEAALNGEMKEHLGYGKHSTEGYNSGNSRNGYTKKTLKSEHGEMEISTPRDRNGEFNPVFLKKYQTRLGTLDAQILALYAKGLSTREIEALLYELYGTEISAAVISQVTESVHEKVIEWQNRPLEAIYPIVYLDCIVVKVRQDKQVINKAIYLVLGINMHGRKELLGLWMSENEGAKFWLGVLTELKNRGVKDVFVACVDGLKGFPEAITAVFPKTQVQLCIVHMVRNSLAFVAWKDRQELVTDLKAIYHSITVEEAEKELDAFAAKWDSKYPRISRSWRTHWANLITFFQYPREIRKIIYTTNAVESLNSVIRKACNRHKLFPNDRAAIKVVYLTVEQAAKNWSMPLQDWNLAINQFMIWFEDRLPSTF